MRHLSLFTGIGGFELAASWVWGDEWKPVAFCEIDKFCQRVLQKHWPRVHIFEDIRDLTKESLWREYAVNVEKMKHSATDTTSVNPAILNTNLNGESSTRKHTTETIEDGATENEQKSLNTTGTNAPVAEKANTNFSPLTTNSITEIPSGKPTSLNSGNSPLSEVCQMITKSCDSTATVQKPTGGGVRTNQNDVPIIEDIKDVTKETLGYSTEYGNQGFRQAPCRANGTGEVRAIITNKPSYDSRIDLLTGGFPCQPFSCAGKRQGAEDARFLWPEMLRVIHETSPAWVIAENVPGLLSLNGGLEFESVYASLENEGYEVQAFVIPACAVNAPHRRDRVWIVANLQSGESGEQEAWNGRESAGRRSEDVADPHGDNGHRRGPSLQMGRSGCKGETGNDCGFKRTERSAKSDLGGMVDGISQKLDGGRLWDKEPEDVPRVAYGVKNRVDRLRALGNAIVPQVAAQLMLAIKSADGKL